MASYRPQTPSAAHAAALVIGIVALLLSYSGTAVASTQGTPVSSSSVTCTVAPRAFPLPTETPIGVITPGPVESKPFVLPAGEPVDTPTATAIEATIAESIACRNAGDFRRAYALFTDRFIAHLLGAPDTLDPDLLARLAASPTPVSELDQLALGDLSQIERLSDGRVGAIAITQNRSEVFADYVFLTDAGGRWQIDEVVPLSEKPRAIATP